MATASTNTSPSDGRRVPRTAALVHASLIFVATALVLALTMTRNIGVYDEGVILTGAMRVAAGDILHADFYANYGPGQFYLLAALFKLFGTSAIIERIYDTLVRAAIVALCYGIVAGVAPRLVALAAAGTSFLWLFAVGLYGYPLIPVTLLSLAAASLVQPLLVGRFSSRRLMWAGAALGLSTLIRYDVGPVVFVALAIALALSSALRSTAKGAAFREARTSLAWFTLGAAVVFLPVAALYLAVAPLERFIYDIFYFSIPNYARMRSLPFPGIGAILGSFDKMGVYVPVLACATAAWSFFADRIRPQDRRDWIIVTFALITLTLYSKGLVRVSTAHLMASILASIVVVAALVGRVAAQGRGLRIAVTIVVTLSVASALTAAATTAAQRVAERTTVLAKILAVIESGQAAWCPTPPELRNINCLLLDPDREQAARLVASHTAPGERIFVGLTRHDKIFMNDIAMYFATNRMPATRWHHFDSGLQTRADIQAEMIAELQAHDVRYVVLESTWDWIGEPNGSARSSDVHLLDEYIRKRYRTVETFGEISVLLRNPAAPD